MITIRPNKKLFTELMKLSDGAATNKFKSFGDFVEKVDITEYKNIEDIKAILTVAITNLPEVEFNCEQKLILFKKIISKLDTYEDKKVIDILEDLCELLYSVKRCKDQYLIVSDEVFNEFLSKIQQKLKKEKGLTLFDIFKITSLGKFTLNLLELMEELDLNDKIIDSKVKKNTLNLIEVLKM